MQFEGERSSGRLRSAPQGKSLCIGVTRLHSEASPDKWRSIPPLLSPSMNEDIHFERRGGELAHSLICDRSAPERRAGGRRRRCRGALCGRGMARLGMAMAAALAAIHPSPSIRSFLHDDGDEAADHDEALEEVRPHHRPQTALQRKPQE